MRCGWRASPSRQTASVRASTARVSRGSITPSSSPSALVVNTLIWLSKRCWMPAFSASILARSTAPLRAIAAAVTMAIVPAACSPPITAVLALGQLKQKRGPKPRPHMP